MNYFILLIQPYSATGNDLEVRCFSQPDYQGVEVTIALKPDNQHIQKLMPAITDSFIIKSVEVGKDVGLVIFEKSDFSGSYQFIRISQNLILNWTKPIKSLIVYRRSVDAPSGIAVWGKEGTPWKLYPCHEFGWGENYYLEGTLMEGKAAFAKLWGLKTSGFLRYDNERETLDLPSKTRESVDDTYDLSDYNAVGKVTMVDTTYHPEMGSQSWWKQFRSLGPGDTVICFEHKDRQGRYFSVGITPSPNESYHDEWTLGNKSSNNTISSIMLSDDVAVLLFDGTNGFGHSLLVRESMNLPKAWDNRMSSFIVFPKDLPYPHGLTVTTGYSGGLFQPGNADIIFLPIHYRKSISKISLSHLPEVLNDRIVTITRSSDLIALKACQHTNFTGKCITAPGYQVPGLKVDLNKWGVFKNISSMSWWLIGPLKDGKMECIDHGNNITSCEYAISSDPGHRPGTTGSKTSDFKATDFEMPKNIAVIEPLDEHNHPQKLRQKRCKPGFVWNMTMQSCVPQKLEIPIEYRPSKD
jgi:hypothetical protein